MLAVVAVGGGLRAAEATQPRVVDESVDERFYAVLARGIAEHLDYGGTSTGLRHPHHAAPGAPALFAVGHRLTPAPPERPSDIPAAYWLLALAGTLAVVATYVLAAALAGTAAGLIAATIVAAYPPLVRSTGELLGEPLGALLLTTGTIAIACAREAVAARPLAGGVLLGLAALTRPDLVLVPLAVAVVVLLGAVVPSGVGAIRLAVLIVVGAAVVVAPWAVFASDRSGETIVVTESDAPTLVIGTSLAGGGTLHGLKRALGDETRARVPRLRHLADHQLPGTAVLNTIRLRRPELSPRAAMLAQARANLRRDALGRPVAFLDMTIDKVGRMWLAPNRERAPFVRTFHLILVLAAVIGLAAGIAVRRGGPLLVLAGALAAGTAVHAVLVAHPRHNLPMMPLLVAGGSAGWALVLRRAGQPQSRSTNASAPVLEPFVGPM